MELHQANGVSLMHEENESRITRNCAASGGVVC